MDAKSAEAKGSKDGKQGEEEDSTTAKGKEGKKSTNGNDNAPGLGSSAVEETDEASFSWMELAAGTAIGIVVTALVIALVMRTKQKAAVKTEMELNETSVSTPTSP